MGFTEQEQKRDTRWLDGCVQSGLYFSTTPRTHRKVALQLFDEHRETDVGPFYAPCRLLSPMLLLPNNGGHLRYQVPAEASKRHQIHTLDI